MNDVHQLRAERGREIVAAALDEDQFEAGMRALQLLDRLQIHGGIFANRRMRAAAGFDARHAIGRQRALPNQKLGVLARVDVVGDDGQVDRRPQCLAQHVDQSGLPAADWPGDADSKRTRFCVVHH